MGERIRVLITVKTYPIPSIKYDELVCTAGVREDGSFIRLYPIDYRYRSYDQWYKKYQWIEVEVERKTNDPRRESFCPLGEIRPLGEPIETLNNWGERKRYVLAKGVSIMCKLQEISQKQVSLGIIKPSIVEDFVVEETERQWKPEQIAQMNQLRLFGSKTKPLEKIPYKFSYKFKCESSECKGHKMMIEDWEVGELYRSMRNKFQDEKIACNKVRDKFYGQICDLRNDIHFFVGTVLQHGTWVILGAFYPKKELL